MADRYFKYDAPGGGDGSSGSPWNTHTSHDPAAGDTAHIEAVATVHNADARSNVITVAGNGITIKGEGALLTSLFKPQINGANNVRGIFINTDVQDTTIEDIELYGLLGNPLSAGSRIGIFENTTGDVGTIATNITLRRVILHGIRSQTVSGSPTDAQAVAIRGQNFLLEDVVAYDSDNDLLWLKGENGTVRRATLYKPGQKSIGSSFHSDCLQLSGACGGFLLEDSYLDAREAVSAWGGQTFIYSGVTAGSGPVGILLRRNRFYQRTGDPTLWNCILIECDEAKLYWNHIEGGHLSLGLSIGAGARVMSNVFVNDYDIGCNTSQDDCIVGQNLFIGDNQLGPINLAAAIRHTSSPTIGVKLNSNIIVNWDKGIVATGSAEHDYNCFWGVTTEETGGVAGSNNITADPRFFDFANGDYRIHPDSPCVGAGDPAMLAYVTHDKRGRPYRNPPSIGPYEPQSCDRPLWGMRGQLWNTRALK